MKLDNDKDLLEKQKSLVGKAHHPIPFPAYLSVLAKKEDIVQIVKDKLKDYVHRAFRISSDNYGLDVSVNYEDGKFVSMILKGTGIEGEVINRDIALQLVPDSAKNKAKITFHGLLTILDHNQFRGGMQKHEVSSVIKQALMQGIMRYEAKEFVCRPYSLFIDGKSADVDFVWEEVGSFLITGLACECSYDKITDIIKEDILDGKWLTPQRGFIIKDLAPDEPGAFSETRFYIDDSEVTQP